MRLIESAGNLGTELLEVLVYLFEALIHPFEAVLHLSTQRTQLGEHQGDFFAAREGFQECMEERRLQVRSSFQQVRKATAEQINQILVTE